MRAKSQEARSLCALFASDDEQAQLLALARIQAEIEASGGNWSELARRLGVSRSTMWRWFQHCNALRTEVLQAGR